MGNGVSLNAQRCHRNTRKEHRTDVADFGVQSTREEDGAEGYGSDNLGGGDVVEMNAESVAAEKHADSEKKQEGGHPETAARLACQNACKKQCRKYEKD